MKKYAQFQTTNAQFLQRQRDTGTKQRDITHTAIKLTLATVVLLFIVTIYASIFHNDHNQQYKPTITSNHRILQEHPNESQHGNHASQNCEDIFKVTSEENRADRCHFARSCNNNDGFPFSPFIFCSQTFTMEQLLIILLIPLFLLLVLLFRMLGSTADDYFSPSLEMFSKKLGLPPRFAGVTLLALGNGAADVSSTISAVTSNPDDGYILTLGSLTGCGMFTGTVVAGIVTVIAGSVKCRGALVRDVSGLAIAMMAVYFEFRTGRIGKGAIILFFSMYGAFIGTVLLADLYHRWVHLPRMQALSENKSLVEGFLDGETIEEGESDSVSINIMPAPQKKESTFPTASSYKYDNGLDIIIPASDQNDIGETAMELSNTSSTCRSGWSVNFGENGADERTSLHETQDDALNLNHIESGESHIELNNDQNEVTPFTLLENHSENDETRVESGIFSTCTWEKSLEVNNHELRKHWNEYMLNAFENSEVHKIDKFFLMIEFPFTLARQLTVPVPTDEYYCRPIVALSTAISPFWFLFYFSTQHGINFLDCNKIPYFLIWTIITSVTSLKIALHGPEGGRPMRPIYSGPIALYGFIVAASWIDFLAKFLVQLLEFLGILFRIPSFIMGLTILTWGNSVGDLSANMTMAKKGFANMAITACFASPLFNILIGYGWAFLVLRDLTGQDEIEVELSASITVGFAFLVLNSIAIIFTGVVICHGTIPENYGYFALAMYSIYVVASIVVAIDTGE